jgi:GDP-4-dehydro-6-deoxy-D-mannose reductase
MKRILVTGATGFIARHLIPALEAAGGWQITGVSRSKTIPTWLAQAAFVRADVAFQREVERIVAEVRPDAVIHLAGQSTGSVSELCRVNIGSVASLLAATRVHSPECRIILVGTAAEYGRVSPALMPITESVSCVPESAYGVSKLAATELGLEAALTWRANVTVVRPFNVIGAGMPAYLFGGALIERILEASDAQRPKIIKVGRLDTFRDFVPVEDIVRALLALLDRTEHGELYNLCSGRPTPIQAVLEILLTLSGDQVSWQVDSNLVRADDVPIVFGCCDKAVERLHFGISVSLESALEAAWKARLQSPPVARERE